MIIINELFICNYGEYYSYVHSRELKTNANNFKMHNHIDGVEVLLFLAGNSKAVVEGSTYDLEPFDIMVANNNEMHMIKHMSNGVYDRVVINFNYKFFSKFQCRELNKIFTQRKFGVNNVLHFTEGIKKLILDIYKKIDLYSTDFKQSDSRQQVITNLHIELLYLLNTGAIEKKESGEYSERIQKIITYINDNLTEKLTLDKIADNHFMNKYYLCRIFKRHTGFTINEYISYKRLIYARRLYNEGKSLTDAGYEAGFESYSNFYKAFKANFGTSPRNMK